MMYDLVVIGSGPGGHAVAESSARLGAAVAVIEKGTWGGTCTHWGCIPTKALLMSSKKYSEIRKLKRMGLSVEHPSFNYSLIKRHKEQMVRVSSLGVLKSLKESGVECMEGEGTIISPEAVDVETSPGEKRCLKTKNIVIAWGSKPSSLPNIELSGRILGSRQFLAMDELPGSIIIVGGGAIGVEFATFLAELGTTVTLIEFLDHILPQEEREAAELLAGELKKLGIALYTQTAVDSIRETDGKVHARATQKDKIHDFSADYALICVGRLPALRTAELKGLSIQYDDKGIRVDENCMTNIEGIFAVGDVTGGMLLAHRAGAQGRTIANNLFGDGSVPYSDEHIPVVVYTHPNIARVGMTEEDARLRGLDLEVKKVEYGSNIIARTEIMGNGFIKFLFSNECLVGATIAGDHAADLIASLSLAMVNEMTKKDLRDWVIPHPTLSEILYP